MSFNLYEDSRNRTIGSESDLVMLWREEDDCHSSLLFGVGTLVDGRSIKNILIHKYPDILILKHSHAVVK
jgi:hypothetical protein